LLTIRVYSSWEDLREIPSSGNVNTIINKNVCKVWEKLWRKVVKGSREEDIEEDIEENVK
jgi:hypothetical protein